MSTASFGPEYYVFIHSSTGDQITLLLFESQRKHDTFLLQRIPAQSRPSIIKTANIKSDNRKLGGFQRNVGLALHS